MLQRSVSVFVLLAASSVGQVGTVLQERIGGVMAMMSKDSESDILALLFLADFRKILRVFDGSMTP